MSNLGKLLRFRQDRDKAFTAFVLNDDWKAVRWYMRKYGIVEHLNDTVMKAGILKAVQEIPSIPEDVKAKAAQKCIEMGFSPFAKW